MSEAKAWTAYWAQMGSSGGCLPGAPPAVEQGVSQLWADFGRRLPQKAELIDLACGTGAVFRAVAAGNPTLRMTGVDYAELPRSKGQKTKLLGETNIGDLPLDDASFDAVTSQFGFEYSDVRKSAAEVVRIARPGALLQMVIHHADSPIVSQNRGRSAALNAIGQSAIFDRAREAIAQSQTQGPIINQTFSLVAQSHPGQSVVAEIAAGVGHALTLGKKRGDVELNRIAENIGQEISVLGALMRAARDQQGINELVSLLSDGFECAPPATISQGGQAPPIAWILSGTRNPASKG